MPRIESQITINAPLEIVWKLAQDVEKLPTIMPDLDAVKVLQRETLTAETTRVVSEWHGRIKKFNHKVSWTEEDIWNSQEHTCHFWQLRGDFDDYRGEWRFEDKTSSTLASLQIDYTFEIPLLGVIVRKVLKNLVQANSDGMLQALRDEAEREAKTG